MSVITKKSLSTLLGIGVLISIIYFSPGKIYASGNSPKYSEIVTRIAQKFNLKESEVEAVFAAVRDERHGIYMDELKTKLSLAVTDGVLTEDQKSILIGKIEANYSSGHDLRKDLKSWLKSEKIKPAKIRKYLGLKI